MKRALWIILILILTLVGLCTALTVALPVPEESNSTAEPSEQTPRVAAQVLHAGRAVNMEDFGPGRKYPSIQIYGEVCDVNESNAPEYVEVSLYGIIKSRYSDWCIKSVTLGGASELSSGLEKGDAFEAICTGTISEVSVHLLVRECSALPETGRRDSPARAPAVPISSSRLADADSTEYLNPERVVEEVRDTVVHIKSDFGNWPGVIYATEGVSAFIVTNARAVLQDSQLYDTVEVMTYDGTSYGGALMIWDQGTDIAIIGICCGEFEPLVFGDASTLEIGREVIAVGHQGLTDTSLKSVQGAVTAHALVSDGTINVIRTDAIVIPQNDGGLLISPFGKFLGINTPALFPSEGLGFAVTEKAIREFIDGFRTGNIRVPPPSPTSTATPLIDVWDLYGEHSANAMRFERDRAGKRAQIYGLVCRIDDSALYLYADSDSLLVESCAHRAVVVVGLAENLLLELSAGDTFVATCHVAGFIDQSGLLTDHMYVAGCTS